MEKSKYYFTFGSDENFPYQNTYLIVIADSLEDAICKFRKNHPDRYGNFVNCAFWYSHEQWDGSLNQKLYPHEPAEIIY